MQLITNEKAIRTVLEQHQQARDNDVMLYAWLVQGPPYLFNIRQTTAAEMLQKMNDGTLPMFESVRRTRQKLQEQHPGLRGDRYADRQRKAKNIRHTISVPPPFSS